MAQRTLCLCDGKYIGIETIYTVIDGKQINIPDKLKELRTKSQDNELFCPCGCGTNLILVAGDRNLREQHFRVKEGTGQLECHMPTEGKVSIDSKIALKCWLDEKLNADDVETRVPIKLVGDTERKYEFTFLSREKRVAISYCHEKANLSDEKFEILTQNGDGIQIIYIVDAANGGSNGQYPEALMKIQDRQGYCLLLEVKSSLYSDAIMHTFFYAQDVDGLWREEKVTEGHLSEYCIGEEGQILFQNVLLGSLVSKHKREYEQSQEEEKLRREEEKKRREERQKRLIEDFERRRLEQQKTKEEEEKARRRYWQEENQRIENKRQAEQEREWEDFRKNLEKNLSQQGALVIDPDGMHWVKCEHCGLMAKENEFLVSRGNIGTCRNCQHELVKKQVREAEERKIKNKAIQIQNNMAVCPLCGGTLKQKIGRRGPFKGCSNFPKCRYTRSV